MAYDLRENSVADGAPIKLYEFKRTSGGTDFYWRYNSSEKDFVHDGNTYISTPISDEGVKQSGEASSSEFVVTMLATLPFALMFRGAGPVPSDQIFLTLRRIHVEDTDARVIWIGTVSGISQPDDVQVKVSCSTLSTSFRRGGLRMAWARNCPHILYDSQCKAIPTSFDIFATIDSINGSRITSPNFALIGDRYLDGGYFQWTMPSGFIERRFIKWQIGNTVEILGTTIGLVVGDVVNAFAGCPHTRDACQNKFNNLVNYGGFAHMPGKSPFSGEPVF